MAVILQITYSKKLGFPGFSSHSCSISLTAEIPDKEMAAEESAKLYQLLQSAVDREIQSVGWMPQATYGMNESSNGNGHHVPNGNGHRPSRSNGGADRWSCTKASAGSFCASSTKTTSPTSRPKISPSNSLALGCAR